MSIKSNIVEILTTLSHTDARLIAVSKTKPVSEIMEAYRAGIRDFGENKVQELVEKQALLPKDIRWHMIGHLQRNKVKYLASFVDLIHGIDSFKLLKEVDKQGQKNNRIMPCLLQVHIAEEESKFGFSQEELEDMLQGPAFVSFKNVNIQGVMGMATFTANRDQIRKEFKGLKQLFDALKPFCAHLPNVDLKEISMGMSGDYEIAVEEGSTMVRVGSAIFGKRA